MNTMRFLLVLGSVIALTMLWYVGCYRVSRYTGDGQLIDNGMSAATDRYVLTLGEINLRQRGTTTFRLADLPAVNFCIGLEIHLAPENASLLIRRKGVNPTLALELLDSEGKIVFTKSAPLATWTWAVGRGNHWAFAYGPTDPGTSPGTYFDALPKTAYTLTLRVLEPDRNQLAATAILKATSGGWK